MHAYDAGMTLFSYGMRPPGQFVIRRYDAVLGVLLKIHISQRLSRCEALRMVYGLLRDRIELLFKGHTRGNHLDFFQKASEKPFSTRSELGFFVRDTKGTLEGQKEVRTGTHQGHCRNPSPLNGEFTIQEWLTQSSRALNKLAQVAGS